MDYIAFTKKWMDIAHKRNLIPPAYRQVQYLSSKNVPSGTYPPWIDTGLKADIDCTYIITGRSASINDTSTKPIMGDGASKTDSTFGIWMGRKKGVGVSASFGQGASPYETGYITSIDTTEWHTYKAVLSTATLYCDGEVIGTATPGTYSNSVHLVLFGQWRNQNNSLRPYFIFVGDVSEFKAFKNGVLIRNLKPVVRISDNKPGFYDLCRSTCSITNSPFYVNAETHKPTDFEAVEISLS